MKKFLVLLLTVVVIFTLGTIAVFATDTGNETTNVAKVGETEYATLQEAVDVAVIASKDKYQTIIILRDIELDETIMVSGGSYVTIFDLNGHNIRSSAEVVIENNGYINITNSGERASITTSVVGGTVIQNNAMFSMMGSNENAVIGDGTGYALKSADYEMFFGMCDLCAGTFDGKIEILSDLNIMSGINGGVYTVDPTPYLTPGYVMEKQADGTYGTVNLSSLFTFKGYSVSESDARVVAGYTVNHEKLAAFAEQKGTSIDFGSVFSIGAIGDKTVEYSLANTTTTNYNIFINGIDEASYDLELVVCMYLQYDDKKYYVTADKNNNRVYVGASEVATITYNQIKNGGSN